MVHNWLRTYIINFLLILLFIYPNDSNFFAQSPFVLPATIIDSDDGMNSQSESYIYKDSKGFVWFGTWNGLHRYDGNQIKVFLKDLADSNSISSNISISQFVEDKKQNLWFGTTQGINKYERSTGKFYNYHLSEFHPSRHFLIGLDEEDNIWFDFEYWTFTFNIETKEFAKKSNIPLIKLNSEMHLRSEMHLNKMDSSVAIFSYGSIRKDPGLHVKRFYKGELTDEHIHFHQDDKQVIRPLDIQVLNDSVLIIASKSGLYEMNYIRNILSRIHGNKGRSIQGCSAITSWNDSTILVAELNGVYFTFNYHSKKIEKEYILQNGNEEINKPPFIMYSDPHGGIWINIKEKGIAYFNKNNLIFESCKYFTNDFSELSEQINFASMFETRDKKLFGYSIYHGAFILNSDLEIIKTFNNTSSASVHISNNNIKAGVEDNLGRFWLATTNRKLITVDPKKGKSVNTRIFDRAILNIQVAKTGDIILTKNGGGVFACKAPCADTSTFKKIEDIPNYLYEFMSVSKSGLLWLHCLTENLTAYDPSDNYKRIKDIEFKYRVISLHALDNPENVLIGSTNGIYKYSCNMDTVVLLNYCKCNYNCTIWSISQISTNHYLLGTKVGIYFLDLKKEVAYKYGVEHGIGMEFLKSIIVPSDIPERILFGSSLGITSCDVNQLRKPGFSDRVIISNIFINDESNNSNKTRKNELIDDSEINELTLNYRSNTISFEFAALNYAGINKNQYQYRMTEIDDEWVDGKNRGFARYANLDPGTYQFEARVKQEPKSVRQVKISISPPYYMGNWFQMIAFIIVIAVAYFLLRLRDARKQRIQQLKFNKHLALESERNRIATDMHDDIGSGLSALNMRLSLLLTFRTSKKVKSFVQELSIKTQELTNKIHEIIWTVNAANDTVEVLIISLHKYAHDFFEKTAIDCIINLPLDQVESAIGGSVRREIFLTYKEALNNIYKHAKATKVQIDISTDRKDQMHILIKDDGIGFNTRGNNFGTGMQSMKSRIDKLGGVFEVKSNSEGTIISCKCPISDTSN